MAYGPDNPSPDLIERYREVFQRPGIEGDANKAALLWDKTGRDENWAGQEAYGFFRKMVGREPTLNELSQFVPIFQGSYSQGVAAIGNFSEMDKLKPENLRKNAPAHGDDVNRVFESLLGRSATKDEIDHFGGLLASGETDPYQLQDFLRGTTEYQSGEDKKFRGGLADELGGYDQKFFSKAKEDVLSRFSDQMGGAARSSALDFALTDLMGQIADKRGQYLANLSSAQYGGNKELALGNYKNTMDSFVNERAYNRNQLSQAYQGNVGRADQWQDYFQQADDFRRSQQGRNVLHGPDWIGLGLDAARTGGNIYGASQMGGGRSPYAFLGGM